MASLELRRWPSHLTSITCCRPSSACCPPRIASRRESPGIRAAARSIARLRRSLLGRHPALARMLLAGFISTIGDRLHQMAMAALILGMTDSMASAGLVFVVSTIPYALFSLPAGALVDRWDRRLTMVCADLVRGILVVLIALAALVILPLVDVLLFLLTCAALAFTPARQA